MKKFIKWLVISSADPSKVSLTVRGALLSIIPTVILIAQMLHMEWSLEQLTQLVEGITAIIATALTLFGLIRKLVLTLKPIANT
jgi:uncharacterized membrane protein